ncbi:MAG: amidase [Chloroflexi bacterium]|nr:amidase [Chloroflexota bacterium]
MTTTYDLKSVKLPRLAGSGLRVFVGLLENPLTRGPLVAKLLKDGGIIALRELQIDDPPTFAPFLAAASFAPGNLTLPPRGEKQKGFAFATVEDYAEAYRCNATNPEQIAERVLQAIDESNARSPALRAIIACQRDDVLAQARASARRFREGKPLGIFDGVPVAIKDEVDMVPYPTTVGTRFLGSAPAREDSTVVARMRAAGALLIGKANMHEIGIGVTGLNPHHGAARNPYNVNHYTGGSSSGPAAAVAAGLCPVAIGADGGGSIRIPSAFCGLVGIKATYTRVSEFGAAPLTWSMGHLGPLAWTARDAALAYAVLAGPDPKDPNTLRQPAPTLEGFDHLDLSGVTLGVFTPWFEHASPAMVEKCKELLKGLEGMGARVREIEIPELEPARVAHVVTIVSEMMAALQRYAAEHSKDYGLDVRANLALAREFTSRDYIQAQRVRTRTIAHFNRALEQVDAIVTPTTGCTAPPIPPDALPDGESDLTTLTEVMRFATLGNLTGLPAISIPAGYDPQGLPVGLQAIGRAWQEHLLLRLANAAEQLVERRAPQVKYNLF